MLLLLLGGCTHQRLMETGQRQLQQQRYEQALETYQRALEEKPGDSSTRQQLAQARTALDAWTVEIYRAAKAADQRGESAKALLLFGKVAQLNRDSYAVARYRELHRQLFDNARYQARILDPQQLLGAGAPPAIEDLWLQDSAAASAPALRLSLETPIFEVSNSSSELVQKYISGYDKVANPALIDAQHDANGLRDDIDGLAHDVDGLLHDIDKSQRRLDRLARQRHQLEDSLHRAAPGSQQAADLHYRLGRLSEEQQQLEKQRRKQQKKLKKRQRRLSDAHSDLDEVIHALTQLPALIEVPVYSDYQYTVEHQQHKLVATLLLTEADGTVSRQQLTVSAEDDSHGAHPVIDLPANDMSLPSQAEMLPQLYQQAAEQSRQLIARAIDRYRETLWRQAQQSPHAREQFALWVAHGLVRRRGADHPAAMAMRRALELEYGVGGEFRINELLHLY